MNIKIFLDDLELGMYVAELDRPWIESPFLFQGFELKTDEEIEDIKNTCTYVYVDTEKSSINVQARLKTIHKNSHENPTSPHLGISQSATKTDRDLLNESVHKALVVRNKTRSYVDEMLTETRTGKIINTQKAKSIVAELANNIIENSDAAIWLTNLKSRDEYTAIHSVNVCVLSLAFGKALGLENNQLTELGIGALLHDIGKMYVSLETLNKPGKLTNKEFNTIKLHPVTGYKMLLKSKGLSDNSLDIVKSHHERLDGTGYPDGLKEDEIRYLTRLVTIIDVYDAITSDRVYHDGMTSHEALKSMYEWAPGNFDIQLVQSFIRSIGIFPVGSLVELKSGHIGLVVKTNEEQRLKPVLIMVMDRHKKYYKKRKLVNLSSPVWEKKDNKPEIHRIIDAKEYNIDVKIIIEEESLSA